MKKIAILTIAYNEQDTIGAVMEQWKDYKHLILHSERAWHGESQPKDETEDIVKRFPNAEFIKMDWKREHEQRNWGLAYLYDYDYVLIVDADEVYTKEDIKRILDNIGKQENYYDNINCYRIKGVITYYKTLDYIIEPPDTHQPVIAVNPKKILFTEARMPNTDYQVQIDAKIHHLSYCKSDEKMKNKFQQFEHFRDVRENWYNEVWKTDKNENVRAYGNGNSKLVRCPAPEEIKKLF